MKKTTKNRIAVLFSALLLAGCGTVSRSPSTPPVNETDLAKRCVAGHEDEVGCKILIFRVAEILSEDQLPFLEAGERVRYAEHIRGNRNGDPVAASCQGMSEHAMLQGVQVDGALLYPECEAVCFRVDELHGQQVFLAWIRVELPDRAADDAELRNGLVVVVKNVLHRGDTSVLAHIDHLLL